MRWSEFLLQATGETDVTKAVYALMESAQRFPAKLPRIGSVKAVLMHRALTDLPADIRAELGLGH